MHVAVVTEGTWGIGEAVSLALQEQGYIVAATYSGDGAIAQAFSSNTGIPIYECDTTDYDACQACAGRITSDHGSIRVLVTNAPVVSVSALHRMSPREWNAIRAANLDATFNITRSVIEDMRLHWFGRIVNVAPTPDQEALFHSGNHPITAAGIIDLTRSLAEENASCGITVNAVAPGYIDTPTLREVDAERINSEILPTIPAQRLGTVKEVAYAVMFLVADNAGFITGSTLTINGGCKMY